MFKKFLEFEFLFVDKEFLDIINILFVNMFFEENNFDFCINVVVYINVEKVESNKE